ncbi:ribonuclease H-like domain-containing protein [Tanacetum coccineum]
MVINSPCLTDKKELAIPGQTTTGKEFSNSLMDGSLPKTIMAYLEKSDDNAEFHQIVDFLSSCSINYALTAVVISESSVRSDLLFDDEDEPQTASIQPETPPTAAPQTKVHQTVVSQIVFHKAQIEPILSSPTTYQRKRKTKKRRRTKKDTELPQTSVPQDHGADEAVYKEGGMDTGGSPRRQETMGSTPAQTRSKRVLEQPNEPPLTEGHTSGSREGNMEHTFELTDNVPPTPHDSPLTRGHIPGSDEGRLKLEELMALCTNLSNRVLALEEAKTAQDRVITRLKLRVRRVESSTDKSLDEEDASKQGRNKDNTKPMFKDSNFDVLDDAMEDVDVNTAEQLTTAGPSQVSTADQVSTARPEVSAATPVTPPTVFDDDEDLTIAQTLVKMRSEKAKDKEKGVAIRDEEEPPRLTRSTTTLQPLPTIDPKDKGKGVLVEEPEKPVKIKRRDQEQEEASIAALYDEYDDIQASIDADALFATKLQQEEREQFTIEERAKFLVEIIEAQRKFRATQRAAEIRSKPPTKSQLRNMMMTYLKNMGKFNHSQLKGKSYKELQRLYKREQKWINDFVPMDSKKEAKKLEELESEDKTAGGKEAADYKQEKEELRMWLTVVPDEEEIVDLEILSAKYPIVDWESQNLGSDIHVYKIIRADGNTSYHKTFSSMLRKLDRQDLMDLHRLAMKWFEDNAPEGYNLFLWGDLKIMFEPNAEDEVWIEKKYPLIKETLQKMLNWRLEAEAESTMAFKLLKFYQVNIKFRGGLLGIMDFYNLVLLVQLNTASDGLSLLARDVLAIPISTVASKSVFSTDGRVLDAFRSSLTPPVVESLICTQDWFRENSMGLDVAEN